MRRRLRASGGPRRYAPSARPPKNAAITVEIAKREFPKVYESTFDQTTSYTSPAAPDTKNAASSQPGTFPPLSESRAACVTRRV
jgi:hypothetical protein